MATEYELKCAAGAETLAAVERDYPFAYDKIQMRTTYFDTPEGELSSRRMTLRLRQENDETVCTCKAPMEGMLRGEWECSCGDIRQGVAELCKLGAPAELQQWGPALRPVCGAAFTRKAACFSYGEGVLELALDSGVLLGGGREIPLCELEIELKSGPMEAAWAFAGELTRRYALVPEQKSKFCRAKELQEG